MEITITDVNFRKGEACDGYETKCTDCGQLRLSFVVADTCGGCGSKNIIKGKIGELTK